MHYKDMSFSLSKKISQMIKIERDYPNWKCASDRANISCLMHDTRLCQ